MKRQMCLFSSHRSLPLQLHSAAAQEKLEETARGRTVAKLLVQCDEGSSSWESLDLWDCSLAKKWQCIQSIQSPHNPFCFLIDAVASGKVARSATGELESMWTSSTTFDAMPFIWAFKDSGIIWDTSSPLTKLVLLSQIGCQIGSFGITITRGSSDKKQIYTRTSKWLVFFHTCQPLGALWSSIGSGSCWPTLSGQHGSFWMTTRRKELPPSRHPRKIGTTSVRCLVFPLG